MSYTPEFSKHMFRILWILFSPVLTKHDIDEELKTEWLLMEKDCLNTLDDSVGDDSSSRLYLNESDFTCILQQLPIRRFVQYIISHVSSATDQYQAMGKAFGEIKGNVIF